MRNHSYENEFDLHENELVGGTHFHMNGFALRLVLTRRQKRTRKWPIISLIISPTVVSIILVWDSWGSFELNSQMAPS